MEHDARFFDYDEALPDPTRFFREGYFYRLTSVEMGLPDIIKCPHVVWEITWEEGFNCLRFAMKHVLVVDVLVKVARIGIYHEYIE